MSESKHRPGSGGTEDNVSDEWTESQKDRKKKKDSTEEAVEREEATGGTGGTKENVKDEWDESQKH